jgi:hypothetical protein
MPFQRLGEVMATYTPPPYFPQSSLAPPDKNRYKKFKLMVFGLAVLLILLLGGIAWGVWHLIKVVW